MLNIRTMFSHVSPGVLYKFLSLALVDEHVINVGAYLAGVELLHEHDAFSRLLQIVVGVYYCWGFTAEFKYDRVSGFGRRTP